MQSLTTDKLGHVTKRLLLITILLSVVVAAVGCSSTVSEWEAYSYDNWEVEYPAGWYIVIHPEDDWVYYGVEFSSISGDTFYIFKDKEITDRVEARNWKFVGPYELEVWPIGMLNGTWDPEMVWNYDLPDKELQEKFDHFVGSFEVK